MIGINELEQENRRLREGLKRHQYHCKFGSAGNYRGDRIEAFNAYAAVRKLQQEFPNCAFYEVELPDPYRNSPDDPWCWSLDLPAEYVRYEDGQWVSHTPQQEQIKAIRSEIRLWAESVNSPLPDYVWVSAYYLAAGYLEETVLQQIRPENRSQFSKYVEELRSIVPHRQVAQKYVFFPGFGKEPDEEVEPLMQKFDALLSSWGIKVTEDTFRVLKYSIDVDENLVKVLDTLRSLHEELKFRSQPPMSEEEQEELCNSVSELNDSYGMVK